MAASWRFARSCFHLPFALGIAAANFSIAANIYIHSQWLQYGTLATAAGAVVGIVVSAILGWSRGRERPSTRLGDVAATLLSLLAIGLLYHGALMTDYVGQASARHQSQANLKQIASAMHVYHDRRGAMPPSAVTDAQGKPLLSWRVAILPYIDEEALYRQVKLDEAWDSPHNIKLLERMPATYKTPQPTIPLPIAGTTFYQVLVGPGTAFEHGKSLRIPHDFPDGSWCTILVIEAGEAVPWTKPEDVLYAEDRPLSPLGGIFPGDSLFLFFGYNSRAKLMNVACADASARAVALDRISEVTLRRAIVRNDGQELGGDW